MNQSTDAVQSLIAEVRSTFETETTINRILDRTKDSLERFLANPASLDQIKESLARVLSRKAIPYGQPVDQDGYGSWRLYTDPNHFFLHPPDAPAFHHQPPAARSWRAGMGSLRNTGGRDRPADLRARRRRQRTGSSKVASASAHPSKSRRGHYHSSRRTARNNCADGKLERGHPEP